MRILIMVAALLCASPAFAADSAACLPLKQMLAGLKKAHQETPAHIGMTASGAPVVITVSPSGSWSIMVAPKPDVLCMIAAGESWADRKPGPPKIPGEDT